MSFNIFCILVFMFINVDCLYVQALLTQEPWPLNAQLNSQREDFAPAQIVNKPLDYSPSASALPREQTVIVVPNSGQTPIRSSPYGYGTNTMTRGQTVVVRVPDEPYVRY